MQLNPMAVVVSDVHYSLSTLQLADTAFRAAIDKAAELKVPLIDAGDLTNDKAILRGEVTNALIKTMQYAIDKEVLVILLVGNHSLINEKGKEHVLHFLAPYCTVIDTPTRFMGFNLIPYHNSSEEFIKIVRTMDPDTTIIAHQGTIGGQLGDYVKDSSAFDPKHLPGYRIFLGHYHKHYSLLNTVSIGNPYTLTFGEANDGPKGFLVVNEDGSFTREILNLRKHVIYDLDHTDDVGNWLPEVSEHDLLWVKIKGPKSALDKINKEDLAHSIGMKNFKLDKIPFEADRTVKNEQPQTDTETLDGLIDGLSESVDYKANLKSLWRELLS